MSGIYIKGMEMPKDCPMCPLAHWDFTGEFRGCNAVNGKKYAMETEPGYPETNFRPSWCPLVPVPEHGRLIDADALAEHKFVCVPHVVVNDKEAGVAYRLGWNTAIEAIMENAETVIGGG